MKDSRTIRSIKNLISGFASRLLVIFLGIIVRTVFIKTLGNIYLSVNGLYSNILSMLSLAEMGFGTAMVYSMYKPLAKQDNDKLASLMNLYGKVYRIVGFIILIIGVSLIPFLDRIIKDSPNLPYLTLYYVLFLLNSVFSYWANSYKRSILIADQKEYISTNFRSLFHIIKSLMQIVLLIIFKSFFVYLITQMICTLCENITVARFTDKSYPALSYQKPQPLSKDEVNQIKADVKALMLSRIAHVFMNSTDNIIISSFVGLSWIGLLSNYTLIIDSVTGVLCQITSAISASLGNYFVEKSADDGYLLFKRVEFMNSWIYGLCATYLFVLLNPFITLWLGENYILSTEIVIVITINFFLQGYINTLWTFRTSLGLFSQGWYRPIMVTIINIVLSIILGIYWGVLGVLLATAIARSVVNVWFDPWIIFKYGFDKPIASFFVTYIFRICEMMIIIVIVSFIKYLLLRDGVTLISFIGLLVITLLISLVMFVMFNINKEEFRYFENTFKRVIRKIIL